MSVYARDGSCFYWMYLERHGRRESTGIRCDAPTAALRKTNRALADQVYHERLIALSRPPDGRATTIRFATFVEWWLKNNTHRRGQAREAPVIRRFVEAFGHMDIADIDRVVVKEWITRRLNTTTVTVFGLPGVRQDRSLTPTKADGTLRIGRPRTQHVRTLSAKPRTVDREIAILKTILRDAVPKYLVSSPLMGMKKLHRGDGGLQRRLLRPEEEAKLLAIMEPDDRALFLLALDGLVRLSDCLDLKWSEVHLADGTIWISEPKNGHPLELPMSGRLREGLSTLHASAQDIYVFPRRRTARTEANRRSGVKQMLARYCRLAGVPYGRNHGGITFHWATRRTGATRMLTSNVDLGTVQKVGGWRSPSVVLGIYHQLIDGKARAAVEAVSRGQTQPLAVDEEGAQQK